MSNFLY